MNLSEILTIIALSLNAVALCIIAYQTFLNRKSLILANQSIDEDRKTRQIEMLPRAHYVFDIQYHLKRWREEIDKSVEDIERARKKKDIKIMKRLSNKPIQSPKGLIRKSFYEKAPVWLSEIYLSGAQYYYDFHAPMRSLWSEKENKPLWELAPGLIDRGRENAKHITNLLSYIDQIVPDSYAQTPASIKDSDFLTD